MNPLTNVRNIQNLNKRELELGVPAKQSWHQQYRESAWVFIGGLDYDLTEGDIICLFSQYGEIVNINLVRDKKTGKSKGFAFLCYENQVSTVLSVDNLNSIKLCGRTIRVDHVEEYRVPKMREDMAPEQQKLALEGCAPLLEEPAPAPKPSTNTSSSTSCKHSKDRRGREEDVKPSDENFPKIEPPDVVDGVLLPPRLFSNAKTDAESSTKKKKKDKKSKKSKDNKSKKSKKNKTMKRKYDNSSESDSSSELNSDYDSDKKITKKRRPNEDVRNLATSSNSSNRNNNNYVETRDRSLRPVVKSEPVSDDSSDTDRVRAKDRRENVRDNRHSDVRRDNRYNDGNSRDRSGDNRYVDNRVRKSDAASDQERNTYSRYEGDESLHRHKPVDRHRSNGCRRDERGRSEDRYARARH